MNKNEFHKEIKERDVNVQNLKLKSYQQALPNLANKP
jgi:hypothetical protein